MRISKASIALLALVGLGAVPADAATIFVNLTGTAANTTTGTFNFNGSTFNTGTLILDPFAPFTIAEGDMIDATLTLVGAFTVPASGEQLFGLNFFNQLVGSPPGYINNQGPMNQGTTVFSNSGGPTGLPSDTQNSGCGNCLASIGQQIPGAAFQFDSLHLQETITSLNAPFTIDGASFSYQLRDLTSGVPEPSTWAMMIIGLAAAGAALRARRQVSGGKPDPFAI